MGLIRILSGLFGGGRNVVVETAGAFRENAEAGAQRRAEYEQAALAQYSAEFLHERRGGFDRFMDGLNRLPRPLIVLAVFFLFASAMLDPIWFASRMQGLALVPDPLWAAAGVIIAFYFGGRIQIKSQEFQRSMARVTTMVPQVVENIRELEELRHDSPGAAGTGTDAETELAALAPSENPAVRAWQETRHA